MTKIWLLVLILGAGIARPETIYFLVGVPPCWTVWTDSYVLPLSKQQDIDYARRLIQLGKSNAFNGTGTIVFANVVAGKDGINRNYLDPKLPEWSWHVSEFLKFNQFGAEDLDGSPTLLENSHDWTLEIGFWAYTVIRELGANPFFISMTPEEKGFGIYWSTPSTNSYVYTLESAKTGMEAYWIPVVEGSWPMRTNHWVVSQSNASASLYRVRAEPAKPGLAASPVRAF